MNLTVIYNKSEIKVFIDIEICVMFETGYSEYINENFRESCSYFRTRYLLPRSWSKIVTYIVVVASATAVVASATTDDLLANLPS